MLSPNFLDLNNKNDGLDVVGHNHDPDGLPLAVPHPVSRTQVCHAAGLTDNTAFHFSLA